MELRPGKKAKCEAPVRLTEEQQRQLDEAAFDNDLFVDANDPFALLLLEAAKTTSKGTWLSVKIAINDKIPREFLEALAQFLVDDSSVFMSLCFDGTYKNSFGRSVEADEAGDDYTALIAAMVGSQSRQEIIIRRCLPLKLEEAIIEVLRQKSTSTSLELDSSMLFAVHPIAFGKMLATTKCLSHLALDGVKVVGDRPYDRSHFQDGLKKNQSLKGIQLLDNTNNGIVNDVLECTEGIESLTVWPKLDSTGAARLNKFVSTNKKLKCLRVHVNPDAVDALCEAVSWSRSLTELRIAPHSHVSAISRMLQHTTSLQKLHLGYGDAGSLETIVVGLEACKTLVSFSFDLCDGLDVNGARALLKVVLLQHNLTEITIDKVEYHRPIVFHPPFMFHMLRLQSELLFYLFFNKQGRALLQENVSWGVWPYALAKAGSSSLPDALYFFLHEKPELVMRRAY